MSGLYFIGLLAIWLFVGWLIYAIWRLLGFGASGKPVWKAVHMAIGLTLFFAWFGSAFWVVVGKTMYYDSQIREMCERDGGITVYETITLPKERFDEYGNVNIKRKERTDLNDDYYYVITERKIREKDPIITKYTTSIYKVVDNKLLGVSIVYGRGGGGLAGLWHPSRYTCPHYTKNDQNLEKSIFKEGSM